MTKTANTSMNNYDEIAAKNAWLVVSTFERRANYDLLSFNENKKK